MSTSQSRGYSPTAKFFSVGDKEMKEMIDHILEQRKSVSDGISLVGQVGGVIPGYEIASLIVQKVLEYVSEEESLHEQILERRIDRGITKYAVNTMKSDIDVVKYHIKRLENINLTLEDRKVEVPVVFNSCRKILNEFSNKEHVYYMHPLITAPLLIAFSQLFTTVCTYGIELNPTYNDTVENERKRLKDLMEEYKINAIEERLKMIKVIQMLKVPCYEGSIMDDIYKLFKSGNYENVINNLKDDAKLLKIHEVDIVKDGFGFNSKQNELHYWDRTLWDQEQQFTNNYDYAMVVKIAYENYFDSVIGATF
ncbi:hypothetical protein RclHR1_03140006 [Rhizophagus clarus]|uniref:Uncharacterized protein n=1 Tax=Rhizophagus clarus TaxID=94130 RepID=A0A2Z6R6T0_9GLOM|nr:hypothetical protein RclHR1_03140006 [Rhizophagus clarus]GES99222.1 hypothetical protein GLOIN_2v1687736 [Rhizophagus clarus]